MASIEEQVTDSDAAVYEWLSPQLLEWTTLSDELLSLMTDVQEESRGRNPAAVVAALITARIQNEARSVCILAQRGYALQAYSVVATMFELTYMIAYVGTNPRRADKWFRHSPYDSLVDVCSTVLASVHLRNLPKEQRRKAIEIDYQHYKELNIGKHGRAPMFVQIGSRFHEGRLQINRRPYISAETLHFGRIVLFSATRLVLIAIRHMNVIHVPEVRRAFFFRALDALERRLMNLHNSIPIPRRMPAQPADHA